MRMRKKPNLSPRMERCGRFLIDDPAAYRGHWRDLKTDAAELRLELAAMPRSGRARRELETRIARLEQMAGETLRTAGYLAHYYDPD